MELLQPHTNDTNDHSILILLKCCVISLVIYFKLQYLYINKSQKLLGKALKDVGQGK